ncbi:MAG: peptidoglycan DD-metalloendopeptidase family protein [Schwartzia sp.]|nr:peptidoglycan DD-metalloendopeptidase family protein [Schwartzia sp. (in: firmicutes)]
MNTKLKKVVCATLAGGTLFFGTADAARTGLKGDVNNDGKVATAFDMSLLSDYIEGKNVSIDMDNADLNGDGRVNISDLNLMKKYVAGIIKEFPASKKQQNTSHNPEGYVDSVVSNAPNQITVRGWTLDRDNVNTALEVHVYVGGGAGSGAPGFRLTANKYRPDVNNVFPGVGSYHGYEGTISVNKTGRQEVHVYAINIAGGSNIELGVKTVDIKGSTPSPTMVPVAIGNGWYKIHPSHDRGRSLDAFGPNNNLHIWTNVDAPQQKFYLQDRGVGFSLQTAGGDKLYVTAEGNGNLDMKPWSNSKSQLFVLLTGGSGTYHIVSKANENLNFDCAGAGKADGTNVQLWTKEPGSAHHKWIFEKTSAPMVVPPVPTPPTVSNSLVGQSITAKRNVSSYQDAGLRQRIGSVDKGDSCTILAISGNSYQVRYPITSNGRPTGRTKVGWVSKDVFEEPQTTGFDWPIPGNYRITTTYTYSSGKRHSCRYYLNGRACGIDIAASVGTRVNAAADGTVITVKNLGAKTSFGKYIEIKHDDGTITLYAHLSEFNVSTGQRVQKGQQIALSGATGNITGPHLHFEMSNTDTYQYFKNKGII